MFAVSNFSHVEVHANSGDIGHQQHQLKGPNERWVESTKTSISHPEQSKCYEMFESLSSARSLNVPVVFPIVKYDTEGRRRPVTTLCKMYCHL